MHFLSVTLSKCFFSHIIWPKLSTKLSTVTLHYDSMENCLDITLKWYMIPFSQMHKSWIYKFKIYAFDHWCWFRTTKTNKKTIYYWPLPLSVMIWPTNNFGYVPSSPFDERMLKKNLGPGFRMLVLYWSRLDYRTFCSVVKFFQIFEKS